MFPKGRTHGGRRVGFAACVPYYSQLADANLAQEIFDRGVDAGSDTRWRDYGAASIDEYAYWCSRACGPACVKMAVEAMGGARRSMMAWIRAGSQLGGYVTTTDPHGNAHEIGWSHTALASLLRSENLEATCGNFSVEEIYTLVKSGGHLMVASVSFELGTERAVTHTGGHLVLVTGVEELGDWLQAIFIHNPSGRSAALRENARIPLDRFRTAYGGRGIDVYKQPE